MHVCTPNPHHAVCHSSSIRNCCFYHLALHLPGKKDCRRSGECRLLQQASAQLSAIWQMRWPQHWCHQTTNAFSSKYQQLIRVQSIRPRGAWWIGSLAVCLCLHYTFRGMWQNFMSWFRALKNAPFPIIYRECTSLLAWTGFRWAMHIIWEWQRWNSNAQGYSS